MPLKFTIAIPAFKRQYIKECIDSCLAQTYENFEVVVVNDHSPEDLDAIVRQYNDPRIRYYVNEENCGAVNVVDNWNKCLDYATGDYIICMGDDDKLLPCCLEEYTKLIDEYPKFNVYHMRTEIIDEKNNVIEVLEKRPEYESVYSHIWYRQIKRRKQYIGDFLFKTNSLREQGGFYKIPLATFSDDITVAIAASSQGIVNSNVRGFQYREHKQTISRAKNWRIIAKSANHAHIWYENFLKEPCTTESQEKFRLEVYNNLSHFFNRWYIDMMDNDMQEHPLSSCLYWLQVRHIFKFKAIDIVHLCLHYIKVYHRL